MPEYVPVGLSSQNNLLVHEILEDYLYNQWSDSDTLPRNRIRFSYKVDQNLLFNANCALKCYDNGSDEESMYSNDGAMISNTEILVVCECRSINNIINDVPNELVMMKNKIRNVIMGNRVALQGSGIILLTWLDNEPIERDEGDKTIYRLTIKIKAKQILEEKP